MQPAWENLVVCLLRLLRHKGQQSLKLRNLFIGQGCKIFTNQPTNQHHKYVDCTQAADVLHSICAAAVQAHITHESVMDNFAHSLIPTQRKERHAFAVPTTKQIREGMHTCIIYNINAHRYTGPDAQIFPRAHKPTYTRLDIYPGQEAPRGYDRSPIS